MEKLLTELTKDLSNTTDRFVRYKERVGYSVTNSYQQRLLGRLATLKVYIFHIDPSFDFTQYAFLEQF